MITLLIGITVSLLCLLGCFIYLAKEYIKLSDKFESFLMKEINQKKYSIDSFFPSVPIKPEQTTVINTSSYPDFPPSNLVPLEESPIWDEPEKIKESLTKLTTELRAERKKKASK